MKIIILILALCTLASTTLAADFALKENDTVAFLGDSITAEGTYGRIIEAYTLLRFPKRNIRFINAGWGGDTAARGLARLQRDVFDKHATVVTVAFGINDIGRGAKADEQHRNLYLDSIRQIVDQCKQHKVRVFICSAAATGSDPDKSDNDFLQKMCDGGMKISTDAGEGSIDILREMRTIQRRIKKANGQEKDPAKHETLHAADTIHLNELGQTAMAYAILKGLVAPADVSSVSLDAASAKITSQTHCTISNFKAIPDTIEFDRLDDSLPLSLGAFGALRYRFIPIPQDLSRYMLTIQNLKAGKHDISVNDRLLGTFTAHELSQGVNLSTATADPWSPGGPWEAQAWVLNDLIKSRFQSISTLRTYPDYLKHHPQRAEFKADTLSINEKLEQLERRMAQPLTYHFVIRPHLQPASSPASSAKP